MYSDLAILFAYHFPPENAIGAARPFRFYKYLTRLGYQCHVISAADVRALPQITGTFIPDPFEVTPRDGMGWQIERAIRKFLLPGVTGSQWSVHAYRAALKILADNPQRRVTIFSTSPPLGTHAAAYWLARQSKLPWIVDCRDPIAGNPALDHINAFTKDVYKKLESLFVGTADFTIANTDTAQERLKQIYPNRADRIELIWNGFDPEERLYPLPTAAPDHKIVAHVGDLYGGRTVAPILASLRRLIDAGRLNPKRFQVFQTGPAVPDSIPDPSFMDAAMQEGWVRLDTERVPQASAWRIIQSADALLLIQPQTALQVPGKLFEYLQIGRPILAFVPPNSPVERILQKSGVPYSCVYSTDTENDFDRSILRFFQFAQKDTRPSEWFDTQFNAKFHADKLAAMIETVHHAHVPAMKSEVLSTH